MTDYVVDFNLDDEDLNADFELDEGEVFNAILQLDVVGSLWGNISGDIHNQTDLQNALDAKADKTDVESVTGALADSIIALDSIVSGKADTTYVDSLTGALSDSITALDSVVSSNYTTLDNKIDSVSGALGDSITALDSIVGNKADTSYVDSITGALSDSISGIDSIISGYGDIVTYNADYFATSIQGGKADTALQPNDNISLLNNDAGYITSASLPTVNNSSVVFQKNGTDFDTITLNQSNNDTINISVPTDTGDLTNGAGFLANNGTGTKALAVGDTSQSTAEGGVAVGYGARANSTYATAIGEDTRANNTNTTVIGRAAKATEARAIAIGSGAEANAQDAIAIKGINNTANTFQVYTYNMLDMSTGLIPDARISSNIARTVDIPTFDTTQMAAINSGANTTNIGQIATNTQDISDEITNRQNADNGLQSQIDALVVASDVFDIVGTYAELQAYDIATVPVNDIIKVLVDSTHNDAATYYRCILLGGVKSWSYIGSEGAYYTKGEADSKFVPQTRTINSKALSNNISLTAADVGALPDSTVIPTVNNSSIDFQINGTSFDTITLNQSSNDTINISVPTDTSDLTNGAGYITAASLPTDYYTKSEIDAIIPQPTKVPIVYYQPTDSYCYTESNNRFYGSHVFEKLYLVQPKTSGTTQVIDMSTTFSLSFTIDYQKAPSSAVTVAEIMTSYSAGKGVLLQLNSTGLYYKNNVTGTTITGTRALTAGNSYDIKAEYDGTHMIISYKLSSDANYTQINSTTCTCDGSNYNYVAIGMNADNGNMSLSSVVLTNGADTLYSYSAGKLALDYDGSTLKLNASNQLSVDFTGYATENFVTSQGYITGIDSTDVTTALGYTPYNSSNPDGFITSAALASYLQKDVAQSTTGTLTFVGQKKILFKQSSSSDKLGFTLYNSSNTELGALEYRPNTISGAALLNLNCPYAADYVGFRYWGTAVNIIAPKVSTAGDYYIPTHITDGNTTVTASNTGSVNISSLLPDISGKQNTLTAGSNITISGDTISATDTTYSDFTGADSITAGTSGLVPAPAAGDDDKILTGDGSWESANTVIGYTPADNTLSNVSSIDNGSAVQSALDDKVNKSGDTLTGGLTVNRANTNEKSIIIQNPNIIAGTNPNEVKYSGIVFNDNNDIQIADVSYACAPNGDMRAYIQTIKYVSNQPVYAGLAVGFDTNGNAFSTFSDTKCCDGQWVSNSNLLSSSTTIGTTSMTNSLNSIIPNDGYAYEILIDIVASTGSGRTSTVAIVTSLSNPATNWNLWLTPSSATGCVRLLVPVAADRVINKVIQIGDFDNCFVYLSAYRRLGTNS